MLNDGLRGSLYFSSSLRSTLRAAFTGLIEKLPEFPLQRGEVIAPLRPTPGIQLAQKPEPILLELFDQFPAALHFRMLPARRG